MPRARVISARPGELPGTMLARGGLAGAPPPVILVCGDAVTPASALGALLTAGIGMAATRARAAIVMDCANDVLARSLENELASAAAPTTLLLGVAPPAAAERFGDATSAVESSYSHVVLAAQDAWGDEPLLAGVAGALAGGAAVVFVLVGGDDGARAELRRALRRRWPVFAIQGSGGLADRVAAAASGDGTEASLVDELGGREVRVFAAGDADRAAHDRPWQRRQRPHAQGGAAALGRELAWELQDARGLKDAWALFATYDGLANRLGDAFERFQAAVLGLGIIATAIALTHDVTGKGLLRDVLHWGAVAAPIVVSLLIALANRRRSGDRWVLLRAAAEAVKSEIYRFRTRTGPYAGAELGDPPVSVERQLAGRLAGIEQALGHTAASDGSLTPYSGRLPPKMYGAEALDDGLSEMDATRYVETRVADQMRYYRRTVDKLDRKRSWLQLVTLGAGGAGALLAAAGAEIWIGLTTAIAGGALAYLGNLQVDNTIVSFNQAASQLGALERDFRVDGAAGTDLGRLVKVGEDVLTKEIGGWVQQMTDALQRQREQQREPPEGGEPAGGTPPANG